MATNAPGSGNAAFLTPGSQSLFTPIPWERMVELSMMPITEWKESEVLNHVAVIWTSSNNYMMKKKNVWVDYTRLYLNQYRKDQMPDSVGSKVLFTKFNEMYATFANDEIGVEFQARALDDFDPVAQLNKVATYDWDEFDGARVWNEWLWDTQFYGVGFLDVSEWDKKRKVLRPKVLSPFISFIDPLAVDRGTSRFFMHYEYDTLYGFMQDPDLDESKVKAMASQAQSFISVGGNINTNMERQAKNYLIGANFYEEPLMANGYFEVLKSYIKNNGKLYCVWTDNLITTVLGIKELKFNDSSESNGMSEIPIIPKNIFSLPRSIIGLGLPDILEDDHRADVRLKNYLFEGIKMDSMPGFLYNIKALMNPRDLSSREIGKNIPMNTAPATEVVPIPKSDVVNDSSLSFMQLIQNSADMAIGRIATSKGTTATDAVIEQNRQNLIYAARAKEMQGPDNQFWYTWLARYRTNLSGNSQKMIRVIGESGMKEIAELKKSDFVPGIDPAIQVRSKLATTPEKTLQRQTLIGVMEPLEQAGGNAREALKQVFYLMDMNNDEITNLLPPTPDEIRAQGENKLIDDEKLPLIHDQDDDKIHISIHMRAEDNKHREAHIQGHILNYLRKNNLPPPGKDEPSNKTATRASVLAGGQNSQPNPASQTAPGSSAEGAVAGQVAKILSQPQNAALTQDTGNPAAVPTALQKPPIPVGQ